MIKLICAISILQIVLAQAAQQKQLQKQKQEQRRIAEISIEGNVDEQIVVKFPWQDVWQVRIKNDSIPQYVSMVQSRFKLKQLKRTQLIPYKEGDVLQQIRRPFTYWNYRLWNIGESLVIFSKPNKFWIVQQMKDEFIVVNKYEFKQMLNAQTHLGVIEDHFIVVVLSDQKLIIFNETNQVLQQNPFNTSSAIQAKRIFVKQYKLFMTIVTNKIYLFRIIEGIIQIVSSEVLNNQGKMLHVSAFQRGQVFKERQQVWILDEDEGIFLMLVSHQLKVLVRPMLIQSIKGCYQMDISKVKHTFKVLLTCRQGISSSFKVLYFDNDNALHPLLLRQMSPYIQRCFSQRFMFFEDYIFSMQDESIDIFVPARDQNSRQKNVYDKYWIGLNELSTYLVRQNTQQDLYYLAYQFTDNPKKLFIYGINEGKLQKKQLIMQNFTLLLNSPKPLTATVELQVDYECIIEDQMKEGNVCSSSTLLHIDIHNRIISYVQYKSINLGIVFTLFTVILALFLLCRYKYGSIKRAANQKLKELTNPDKIVI